MSDGTSRAKSGRISKESGEFTFPRRESNFRDAGWTKKKRDRKREKQKEKGKKGENKICRYVRNVHHSRTTSRAPFLSPRTILTLYTYTHTHIEALETIELAGWRVLLARRFSRWKRARMVDGEYSRYTTYWQYRRIGYWHRGKCNFRHEHWIGGSRFYPEARGSRGHARLSVSPVRISSIGTHIFCRSERTLAACRFHFPYIPR